MNRNNSSVFADKEKFIALASDSSSIREMIRKAGLRAAGGSYGTVKKWAKIHKVDLPKTDVSAQTFKTRVSNTKHTLESVFVVDSKASRAKTKKLIKEHSLLPWTCGTENCAVSDEWLGKPIVLQLEHINGINNDNRIENLLLLCPNCHSQTETYAGKAFRSKNCANKDCNRLIRKSHTYCDEHWTFRKKENMREIGRRPKKDVNWPSPNELLDKLKTDSYTSLAKQLGVSDNAVRKYLQRNMINPPRKHRCG